MNQGDDFHNKSVARKWKANVVGKKISNASDKNTLTCSNAHVNKFVGREKSTQLG